MTKVHWTRDIPRCSCGDSFCSDDYMTDEMIACGARTHAHERTRQMTAVTCAKCRATEAFQRRSRLALKAMERRSGR